eukprot:COSAG02_NODE_4845_length_4912_cov_11.302514_5_plen_129_part_00
MLATLRLIAYKSFLHDWSTAVHRASQCVPVDASFHQVQRDPDNYCTCGKNKKVVGRSVCDYLCSSPSATNVIIGIHRAAIFPGALWAAWACTIAVATNLIMKRIRSNSTSQYITADSNGTCPKVAYAD